MKKFSGPPRREQSDHAAPLLSGAMEENPAKRVRDETTQPTAAVAAPVSTPATWPSSASLYANGLQGRAESLSGNFVVEGSSWRAQHLTGVDDEGAELRRRQAAARRAMLPPR